MPPLPAARREQSPPPPAPRRQWWCRHPGCRATGHAQNGHAAYLASTRHYELTHDTPSTTGATA